MVDVESNEHNGFDIEFDDDEQSSIKDTNEYSTTKNKKKRKKRRSKKNDININTSNIYKYS